MRHFFFQSGPVAGLTGSMMTSSTGAILVALTGQSLVLSTGGLCAGWAAVNIAAVTMAAYEGLGKTAGAIEQAAGKG